MSLEFLNQNSGAFVIIFSAIVAIATVVYALLTWRLVSETKRMREVQTEPKISIIAQPREEWINFVDMIIQNIGFDTAYNIKFKIDPDFEYRDGKFLSDLGFMKKGLAYLAPNQGLRFFLTSMVEKFEEKIDRPFEFEVIYENSIGKNFKETYSIDFSELVGLSQVGEPPMYKIVKNLEKLQDSLSKIASGFRKIKVITYTPKDIEEENKQLLEQLEQAKKDKENR